MLIRDPIALERYSASRRVWQGIPGIARTRGGRTFICFYSGDVKETYGNYAVVLKSDDGKNFGEPILVAHKTGHFRCFDPVLWIDPLGRLWFFWNVMPGEEVMATVCENPDADTLVFGEELCIGRGIMMNKPLVLSTGEWLFPIAIWRMDLCNDMRKKALRADDVAGSYVYRSSDNGKTFVKLGYADVRNRSFDEHMVMELDNGVLRMLVRLNDGIGESYSYDRGKSWSRGAQTELGGPNSRFFIQKLRSGRVLLINHYKFQGRNNLTALLSEDDGRTFPYTLLLDGRDSVSYPDAIECDDGFIYVVYDRERGCFKHSLKEVYADAREILTAKITEADIINGALCTEGSYLQGVASRLDTLAADIEDPFLDPVTDDATFAHLLIEGKHSDPIGMIFEKYPVNCVDAVHFDTQKLDTMIARFEESGRRDEALLREIVTLIRRAPHFEKNVSPIVIRAKEYIDSHLAEDFSVSELAEGLGISRYYLAHLFKDVTGTGITEYRNEMRLTRAKHLLVNTAKSIGDIAQELGFCTAAYFAEVFARSEKVSPGEFRKYHQIK